MKILILSTYDLKGGAGKAAFRLLKCLKTNPEFDAKMFVYEKSSSDENVFQIQTFWTKYFGKLIQAFDNLFLIFFPNRNGAIFSTAWISLASVNRYIKEFGPDVINIHWVNNGFISLNQISQFPKNIPIVFSLHDRWLMTGGCHVSYDCDKYKVGCEKCVQISSKYKLDLSAINFNRKKALINGRANFNIIGVSKWMKDSAEKSEILNKIPSVNLPNPIDTNFYSPLNKEYARSVLGISTEKTILLFGAFNATTDFQKGFHYLKNVIDLLDQKKYLLVIFGNNGTSHFENLGLEFLQFGHIHDEMTMRILLSAADIFLLPSLQENLSNSVMESLSCGLPIVAFDVGGNSDLVKHKVTGYLAKPFDILDFSNGIDYISNEDNLGSNARAHAQANFDYNILSKSYFDYFKTIILK